MPRRGLLYTYALISMEIMSLNLQGDDSNIEADYSEVYFSLARQYGLNDEEIFVTGKFNNYELKEEM